MLPNLHVPFAAGPSADAGQATIAHEDCGILTLSDHAFDAYRGTWSIHARAPRKCISITDEDGSMPDSGIFTIVGRSIFWRYAPNEVCEALYPVDEANSGVYIGDAHVSILRPGEVIGGYIEIKPAVLSEAVPSGLRLDVPDNVQVYAGIAFNGRPAIMWNRNPTVPQDALQLTFDAPTYSEEAQGTLTFAADCYIGPWETITVAAGGPAFQANSWMGTSLKPFDEHEIVFKRGQPSMSSRQHRDNPEIPPQQLHTESQWMSIVHPGEAPGGYILIRPKDMSFTHDEVSGVCLRLDVPNYVTIKVHYLPNGQPQISWDR